MRAGTAGHRDAEAEACIALARPPFVCSCFTGAKSAADSIRRAPSWAASREASTSSEWSSAASLACECSRAAGAIAESPASSRSEAPPAFKTPLAGRPLESSLRVTASRCSSAAPAPGNAKRYGEGEGEAECAGDIAEEASVVDWSHTRTQRSARSVAAAYSWARASTWGEGAG